MLRLVGNKRFVTIAFLPFFGTKHPHDDVADEKLSEISPTRVGIDKMKRFFHDENGFITDEAQSVLNATSVGFICGFVMGGVAKSRLVAQNFLDENQATVFRNHFEARQLLNYKIALALVKGGLPFGFKLATFCFLFSGTSAVLQSYKGKFDAINHVVAGSVAGAVYKMNMGLKGAFAGGVLGAMLGSISGTMTSIILFATGKEMGDLFKATNKWINMRREVINKNMSGLNEEHVIFRKEYDDAQNVRKIVYQAEE